MYVTILCNLFISNKWDIVGNLQPFIPRRYLVFCQSGLLLLVGFFFITLWKSPAGLRGCFQDEETSARECLHCSA